MCVLAEWRIRDVEQKAEKAASRLYEIDALRSELDCLARTCREICSEVTWLRAELETTKDQYSQDLTLITENLELLEAKAIKGQS